MSYAWVDEVHGYSKFGSPTQLEKNEINNWQRKLQLKSRLFSGFQTAIAPTTIPCFFNYTSLALSSVAITIEQQLIAKLHARTIIGSKTLRAAAPIIWTSSPLHVRQSPNFETFKCNFENLETLHESNENVQPQPNIYIGQLDGRKVFLATCQMLIAFGNKHTTTNILYNILLWRIPSSVLTAWFEGARFDLDRVTIALGCDTIGVAVKLVRVIRIGHRHINMFRVVVVDAGGVIAGLAVVFIPAVIAGVGDKRVPQ